MNTSTNRNGSNEELKKAGGAFADGLTLIRLLLTPVVMFFVIKGWPDNNMALLASILFAIAALTDLFDDMSGGTATAPQRQFGWFDDIADTVLITGTLAAMAWVIQINGLMSWAFAIPALIIIGRELVIGLVKGFELTRDGWPETRLDTLKMAIIMLAVCLLLSAPWLTTWLDTIRADDETVMNVYDNPSTYIWHFGQILLWIGALLSVFTGYKILTGQAETSEA